MIKHDANTTWTDALTGPIIMLQLIKNSGIGVALQYYHT